MAKVGVALTQGRTGTAADAANGGSSDEAANGASENDKQDQTSVKPQFFKSVVGRGHPDFSTKQQQVLKFCILCAPQSQWHMPAIWTVLLFFTNTLDAEVLDGRVPT